MRKFVLTLILLTLHAVARAEDQPPLLDCTGPTGADAKLVAAAQRAWAKHLGEASHEKQFPLDQDGKVMIEMVLLPPGKYFRGEGNGAVVVTLTQPLWVGKHEITQKQYAAVMGRNPSHFKRAATGLEAADNPLDDPALYPVEAVDHVSAGRFCDAASAHTGAEFRLLREAEWEYACRAGTRTKFYTGDTDETLDGIAQHGGNNRKMTERIGSKAPNAFGLYDMSGNVREWCSDYWTGGYDLRTTTDPLGPDSGQGCVTRGGCWASSVNDCRSAHRSRDAETYAGSHLGFRIARVPSSLASREAPAPLDCSGPTGADAKTVVTAQRAWAKYLGEHSPEKAFPLDKARQVTVEMVLLPPGKFWQGNEKDPVLVTLSEPLWVGKYEVTQRQYDAVTGNNPGHFRREGAEAATHPVEMVSHQQATKLCQLASAGTGAEFRLLWQAEWEYAYRAGTRTKYYNGDADDKVFEIAQCNENNFVRTAQVGSKLPNPFGLFDQPGNVAEWCADAWQKDFVETQTIDPRGPGEGTIFVNRGNAWDSYGRTCNATARSLGAETYAGCQIGFRLARAVDSTSAAKQPTLEIIDTHVHFFDPKRPTAPKRTDDQPLPAPILPADLQKLAQPFGVTGALIVEASPLLEDNQWWLDLAAKDTFIVGVVGRVSPASDDFEKNVRRFAANPLFRGIRIYQDEVEAGLEGNLVERCKVLEELGLTLDVNGGPDMPAAVALLATQLPELRIVINHAANLRIDGEEPPAKWIEGMEAAAKHPNVYCKVSALVEQTAKKPAPRGVDYYKPVLDTLWKLFGEDRLLFGSNWPVSDGGAPYETVVGIVRDYYAAKGKTAAARFFQHNSRSAYQWQPRPLTNSLGMKLVSIPPGKFTMGSPETEAGRESQETPHEVELTKGFYLSAHEVTVGQFKQFVADTKYQTDGERDAKGAYGANEAGEIEEMHAKFTWKSPGFEQTDDHPVVSVSWNDAKAFCKWLSEKGKKTYRLPTEAEWEYACRAGTQTAYSSGDTADALAQIGINRDGSHKFTAPVGQFRPNSFGLYDMHGNVWEWCEDWYDPKGYIANRQTDPTGPATGTDKVQRGGGWSSGAKRLRSAARVGRDQSAYRGCYLGLRVVLVQ